jgi:hypothetical protein
MERHRTFFNPDHHPLLERYTNLKFRVVTVKGLIIFQTIYIIFWNSIWTCCDRWQCYLFVPNSELLLDDCLLKAVKISISIYLCICFAFSPSIFYSVYCLFQDIQNSCEPSMFSLERLLFSISTDGRTNVEVLKQVYSNSMFLNLFHMAAHWI